MFNSKLLVLEERIVLDAALGAVIYVDVNATGPVADGTSWQTAYTNLQDALASAASTADPEQIWVADGTYHPGAFATDAFVIADKTSLFGGFQGNETLLSQRDPVSYVTVLSGDILGNDIAGDPMAPVVNPLFAASKLDNSLSVVTIGASGAVSSSLDGFTITGGL